MKNKGSQTEGWRGCKSGMAAELAHAMEVGKVGDKQWNDGGELKWY
jgi:hypothetical protein